MPSPATKKAMNWTVIGSFLLALAVALGAFGAHGLKNKLDAYSLSVYEKAVFYHFIHALGILVISTLVRSGGMTPSGATRSAALLFAGIFLFSGSLYVLAISGVRALGAITPLGGIAFIAGWLYLALDAYRAQRG